METESKVDKNIEALGKLFPNTLTEVIKGYDAQEKPIIEQAIDFDLLKQELSKVVVDGYEERYQMNWPDKKKSMLLANSPIDKTLRPCKKESVDFDSTENLYIEGDNLDVLKLLQETYLNRVKMIYIDPPYNIGGDSFVYNDDFSMDGNDFSNVSGQYDEDGNMLFDVRQNNESNGRFHTDWLNMMYPRLKLGKDLLTEDGIIFISIDDNEVDNLKKVCNEVFGENNFIAQFNWKRKKEISSDSKNVAIQGEYILAYSKSSIIQLKSQPLSKEYIDSSYNDPNEIYTEGKWRPVPLTVSKGLSGGGYNYEVETPTGVIHNRLWAYPEKGYYKLVEQGRVYFGKDNNGIPQRVIYANESKGQPITNYWDNTATNKEGKKEILEIFGDNFFDTPKPINLITRLMKLIIDKDCIVIDFFSGSATTAHAIMQLNAEDGGKRKFIMVQLPEEIEEKSEAYKAGYKNICEIGKERIRRAGTKIKKENLDKAKNLDTGFRVLKLDSTNMKEVFYKPAQYVQGALDGFEENIKEDRSAEDLLFQVMLELGELLSSDIEEKIIAGKKVFCVAGRNIIACFDTKITNEVVTEIAKLKPMYAVFRDNCMVSDSVATNFEEIFKTYSPNTTRKVL